MIISKVVLFLSLSVKNFAVNAVNIFQKSCIVTHPRFLMSVSVYQVDATVSAYQVEATSEQTCEDFVFLDLSRGSVEVIAISSGTPVNSVVCVCVCV
jgi:hypothetical protein